MRPLDVTSEILVQNDEKYQFSLVVHELELLQKWSPCLAFWYTFQVVPHCSVIHHCGTLAHAFWRTDLHLFIRLQLTQVRHSPLSPPQKLNLIGFELSKHCLISSCLKLSAKALMWWCRDLIAILFAEEKSNTKLPLLSIWRSIIVAHHLLPIALIVRVSWRTVHAYDKTILERWWGKVVHLNVVAGLWRFDLGRSSKYLYT